MVIKFLVSSNSFCNYEDPNSASVVLSLPTSATGTGTFRGIQAVEHLS